MKLVMNSTLSQLINPNVSNATPDAQLVNLIL